MTRGALVLCYHAVSDRWPCELAIPAARLERQLRLLLARGYRAVTFSQVAKAPRSDRLLAVTFDDGYQSILDNGLPVLERLAIPATLFMPSAFVDEPRLSWSGIDHWLEGPFAEELTPMSWASLRRLVEAGWEIGSHTCSHRPLAELSDEELREELFDSRLTLERGLGLTCRSVAYPYGAADQRVIAAARQAGYEAAATLPIRLGHPEALAWPRVGLYRTDGSGRFRIKVSRMNRALRATPEADWMLAVHRLSLAAHNRRTDGEQPAVLVTDGGERSILALTRALGRRSYRVGAVAASRPAAAQWSRFCAERLLAPDPLRDEKGYVECLERAVRSGRYSIVIPGSDAALLFISKHRVRLEPHVLLGLPPHEIVLRTLDKLALESAAAGTGLVVPKTVLCADAEDGLAAARRLGYPVVVKPRSSVFECGDAFSHLPGRVVHGDAELVHVAPAYGREYLVQTFEDGPLYSYGGVFAYGRLLASSLSRCWRTARPDGGNIAFSRTVPVPDRLRASVAALLRRIGHAGIFELELITCSDGSCSIIDFNPRPYGELALPLSAGANLPGIWCDWLRGGGSPAVEARAGCSYRWEEADLFNLACNLREGHVRAGAHVLIPHRHVTHAFFAATDPAPFAAHTLRLGGDLLRHGFGDRRELGLRAPR
jgi:peptidoglycan/xylan/chitin deacetylase (PgdA/CDA1 family)/predicted ATP-grasp superfamily ATP-dependent carboligase